MGWRPHSPEAPTGQGDILLAPIARVVLPAETPAGLPLVGVAPPRAGDADGAVLPLWPGTDLESALVVSYTWVMVLTHDCAVDKDLNRRAGYLARQTGSAFDAAAGKIAAEGACENLIQVAPIRPVKTLPPHVSPRGEEFILLEPPLLAWPAAEGPWVADLGRATTISARAADMRYALADEAMKHTVQAALCYYFASRSTRLSQQLSELFARAAERVEVMKPPPPQPPKAGKPMRIRVWWPGGQRADLDATFEPPLPSDDAPPARTAGAPGRRGG